MKKDERVSQWRHDIVEAIRKDGLAEEFFFHGTSDSYLQDILREGVTTTDVVLRYQDDLDEDGEPRMMWTHGTYWATPRLAAWYAADTAINRRGEPVLIACPRSWVREEGELTVDEMTLDFPPEPLLENGTSEELARGWEQEQDKSWKTFFNRYESLVCLGPVGPERLIVLRGAECVAKLREALDVATVPLGP